MLQRRDSFDLCNQRNASRVKRLSFTQDYNSHSIYHHMTYSWLNQFSAMRFHTVARIFCSGAIIKAFYCLNPQLSHMYMCNTLSNTSQSCCALTNLDCFVSKLSLCRKATFKKLNVEDIHVHMWTMKTINKVAQDSQWLENMRECAWGGSKPHILSRKPTAQPVCWQLARHPPQPHTKSKHSHVRRNKGTFSSLTLLFLHLSKCCCPRRPPRPPNVTSTHHMWFLHRAGRHAECCHRHSAHAVLCKHVLSFHPSSSYVKM